MSAWRGWSEEQLRGSKVSSSGFTAINTSKDDVVALTSNQDALQQGQSHFHITQSSKTARRAVSEYLGRDDAQPTVPVTRTKGRKRACLTRETTNSSKCRRLSNNLGRDMSIATTDFTAAPVRSLGTHHVRHAKQKKPSKEDSKKDDHTRTHESDSPVGKCTSLPPADAMKPVTIHGQTTTMMQALDPTSVHTSIESLKGNDGQGYTEYHSSSVSCQPPSNMQFSQPWLNTDAAESKTSQAPPSELQGHAVDVSASDTHLQRSGRRAKLVASQKNSDLFLQPVLEESNTSQNVPELLPAQAENKNHLNGRHPILERDRGLVPPVGLIDDDDDDFSELDEQTLEDLAKSVEPRPRTPPARNHKQNIREVDENEDYGGALLSVAEIELLAKFKAPENSVQPIVRTPFPSAILDRSPIFGASNGMLLRTCFRLGEALNAGCQAVRCGKNIIIELYARVTSSWREEKKQHFVFKDMYHDKPPFLDGTYELWDQATLWDFDSGVFLGPVEISLRCRVIGKMRRDGQKWRLEILSVWEADASDIDFAAGIYADDAKKEFHR